MMMMVCFFQQCLLFITDETTIIFAIAEVTLQFTQDIFELQENDIAGLVCVEIASGVIVRNIPFSVQSILSESTTAERKLKFTKSVWITINA